MYSVYEGGAEGWDHTPGCGRRAKLLSHQSRDHQSSRDMVEGPLLVWNREVREERGGRRSIKLR